MRLSCAASMRIFIWLPSVVSTELATVKTSHIDHQPTHKCIESIRRPCSRFDCTGTFLPSVSSSSSYAFLWMWVFFCTCSCLNLFLLCCAIWFNNILKEIHGPLSQAHHIAVPCIPCECWLVHVYNVYRDLKNQYKKRHYKHELKTKEKSAVCVLWMCCKWLSFRINILSFVSLSLSWKSNGNISKKRKAAAKIHLVSVRWRYG